MCILFVFSLNLHISFENSILGNLKLSVLILDHETVGVEAFISKIGQEIREI